MLCDAEGYLPASHFARALGVSSKTIYTDVSELQNFCDAHSVDLIKNPRNGIRLECDDPQLRHRLVAEAAGESFDDPLSLERRRVELARRLLVEGQTLHLENLVREFYVAKTSLYSDIRWLDGIAVRAHARIISSTEGVEAKGTEEQLQMAARELVLDTAAAQGMDYAAVLARIADHDIVEAVIRLLTSDYADLTDQVSEHYLRSLVTLAALQASRLRRGARVVPDQEYLFNNIRYMETFVIANSIAGTLRERLGLDYQPGDIEYLSRQLFAHRITAALPVGDQEYDSLVRHMVRRVGEMEGIDLTHDQQLHQALLYHVSAMVVRLQRGIRIENPLKSDIRRQYGQLFSVLWVALSFMERDFGIVFNDDEVTLLLAHFQVAIERTSQARNIVVVCQFGLATSQMVRERVRQYLPAKDNVEASPLQHLIKNTDGVDMVISTLDLTSQNLSIPWVRVNPLVTTEDLVSVMRTYTEKVIGPQDAAPTALEEVCAPRFASYLRPDLVSLGEDFATKDECLDAMLCQLETMELVQDGYRRSIFDREQMGATALESGVAIPHAAPEEVRESSVSVMGLSQPLDWDGVSVELVILVSLAEQDVDDFRDVITEVYKMTGTRELVHELASVPSAEEFASAFQIP